MSRYLRQLLRSQLKRVTLLSEESFCEFHWKHQSSLFRVFVINVPEEHVIVNMVITDAQMTLECGR